MNEFYLIVPLERFPRAVDVIFSSGGRINYSKPIWIPWTTVMCIPVESQAVCVHFYATEDQAIMTGRVLGVSVVG